MGPGLDRERLYWELSQLTYGITQLGPYSLDQDSLYVNGEELPFLCVCIASGSTLSFLAPFPLSLSLLTLSFSTCAGYTHQTETTTPSSEYSELQKPLQTCKSHSSGTEEARSPLPPLSTPTPSPASDEQGLVPKKVQGMATPSLVSPG